MQNTKAKHLSAYNAFLFDWDGTLSKTLDVWLVALQKACRSRGITQSDRKIAEGFGNWLHFTELGVTDLDVFEREIKTDIARTLSDIPMYEGAVDFLEQLKQQCKKLALISSSSRDTLTLNTAFNTVEPYFDTVITGDMLPHNKHKPDPECLLMALKKIQVSPEEAIMLGDSDKDLGAAVNAGIDSLLFYPENHVVFHNKETLLTFNPVMQINSWQQLLA